jgi:probable rRNA maturation factor
MKPQESPALTWHVLRHKVRCSPPKDLHALAGFVLTGERVAGPVTLTLDFITSKGIQSLNRRFRGVDRPTDVIAFQYVPSPALEGDIAINVPLARQQARQRGYSLHREIRILLIHGILHLLGYTDYEPRPRRKMFQRQNALLRAWEKIQSS